MQLEIWNNYTPLVKCVSLSKLFQSNLRKKDREQSNIKHTSTENNSDIDRTNVCRRNKTNERDLSFK